MRQPYVFTLSLLLFGLNPAQAAPQPKQPQSKIINGQIANASQFPWQVGLMQGNTDLYDNQFCSGTIIAARWVLTAAHCVAQYTTGSEPFNLHIIAGATDLFDEKKAQVIAVQRIDSHPQFVDTEETGTPRHDIALLYLSQPIDFVRCGQRCQQIDWLDPRTEADSITIGTPALINGWGRTVDCSAEPARCETLQETSQGSLTLSPNKLRWASVNITSCLAQSSWHDPRDLSVNMLCAAAPRFDRDTCQGDSGSGMTVTAADGRGQVLAGITSWGDGCAQANYPAVYTRVARYDQWIRNRMAGRPSSADAQVSDTDNSTFWRELNRESSSLSTHSNSDGGGAIGLWGLGLLAGLGLLRQQRAKKTARSTHRT